MKRVRHNGQATLLVNQINAALDALAGGHRPLQKEAEQMPFAGADFLADDQLEAVVGLRHKVTGSQGAFQGVVIGDGNDIEISIALHMVQQLFRRAHSVAGGGVHVEVC